MTDYYVDVSAVGIGTGLTPTDAFVSATSIPFTNGDRAWMRNTHVEFIAGSIAIGSGSILQTFAKNLTLIGWPQPGDPFYSERPALGTTAGWDGDAGAAGPVATYGLKMPVICGSTANATGFILGPWLRIFNAALQNNADNAILPWHSTFVGNNQCVLDNVCLLSHSGTVFGSGGISWRGGVSMGKITTAFSGGATNVLGGPGHIRHLVIASLSQFPALFLASNASAIGLLEIQSNSVANIIRSNGQTDFSTTDANLHIGRVAGILPVLGVSSTPIAFGGWQIDDYYGTGPIMGGASNPSWRVASINEAAANIGNGAGPAVVFSVRSLAATNQQYGANFWQIPLLSKMFAVSSGVGIEIRVPIYVDSTAVCSITDGTIRGALRAVGTSPRFNTRSSVLPGTPSNWTGSLISAGSAWLFSAVFTPTETSSSVMFDLYPPHFTQATSGQALKGDVFFGEPYKV